MSRTISLDELDALERKPRTIPIADLDAPAARPPAAPGIPETIARHGLQGLTFNFSDELGGIGAKIGDFLASKRHGLQANPNAYTEGRDEEREALKESARENPRAAFLSELVGALAVPVPGVLAVKGAGLGAKAARTGVAGASGVLAGTGAAVEQKNIPTAAAMGGVAGAVLPSVVSRAVVKPIAKVGGALKKALGKLPTSKTGGTPAPAAQWGDDAAKALERPRLDAGDVPESVYADPSRPKTLLNPRGDVPEAKNLGSEKVYSKPPRVDVSSVPRAKPEQSFDEMFAESVRKQDAADARKLAVADAASDAKIAEIMAEGSRTGAPFNASVAPSRPLGENEVDVGIRSLLKSAKRDAAAREASGLEPRDPRSMSSQLKSVLGKPKPDPTLSGRFDPLPGQAPRIPQSDDDLAALLAASLKNPRAKRK